MFTSLSGVLGVHRVARENGIQIENASEPSRNSSLRGIAFRKGVIFTQIKSSQLSAAVFAVNISDVCSLALILLCRAAQHTASAHGLLGRIHLDKLGILIAC